MELSAHILVVDDEENVSHLVASGLRMEGFEVTTAASADAAREAIGSHPPDLLLLDLMLDGTGQPDGLALLRALPADAMPVIVLTGHDSVPDRVEALRAGADDWVLKPFLLDELIARVHAVLRRSRWERSGGGATLRVADLVLDEDSREVTRAGRWIALTATEFELLRLLMRNVHVVLSRETILDRVWNHRIPGPTKSVEIYIGYLRRKVDSGAPELIHTVRGVGYTVRPPRPAEEAPR